MFYFAYTPHTTRVHLQIIQLSFLHNDVIGASYDINFKDVIRIEQYCLHLMSDLFVYLQASAELNESVISVESVFVVDTQA